MIPGTNHMSCRARFKGVPTDIPSRDHIHRAADQRLLEGFSKLESCERDDMSRLREVATQLAEERYPVAVVAALLGEADHGGPCAPRHIEPMSAQESRHGEPPRQQGRSRPTSANWARFQEGWGKHHGADPRRLLTVVCRRGGIGSSAVGAITIGSRSSMVEVSLTPAKISVAAVRVAGGEINVGNTVRITGHTTDLTLTVDSIHMEHSSVPTARAGDEVGIKVSEYVREQDSVSKIVD